jgi:hypothetical protein
MLLRRIQILDPNEGTLEMLLIVALLFMRIRICNDVVESSMKIYKNIVPGSSIWFLVLSNAAASFLP